MKLQYCNGSILTVDAAGDGFGDRPAEWITFFTNWTWILFGVWTLLGTYITCCHLKASVCRLLLYSSFTCTLKTLDVFRKNLVANLKGFAGNDSWVACWKFVHRHALQPSQDP